MKHIHILIALAMLAALTMVSCGNNKKAQNQEPTQEEVQEMKQALADTVLAYIDSCVEKLCDATSKSFRIQTMELTDEEKMIKPDYLLDPSVSNNLVTKTQKINALAIYLAELGIRKLYDMPQEETKEVIAKLALDVNHPIDDDLLTSDTPTSEKMKKEYEICKERGDVAYFWQFQVAALTEISYLLAQNPELFFSKITDEQWQSWAVLKQTRRAALEELAKYDEEMAQVWELRKKNRITASDEENNSIDQSIDVAKQYYIANKDKYIAKRNALLQ